MSILKQKAIWMQTKLLKQVALPAKMQQWNPALQKVAQLGFLSQPTGSFQDFITCDIEHDAKNLNQIDIAWSRIQKAIRKQEKVLVYGDYDVDGLTSTTIMYEGLKLAGVNVDYLIPNRRDGYGPSVKNYQKALDAGVSLIVTVDNGIGGRKVIDQFVDKGLDVIVTDHHTVNEHELPQKALALVHPQLSPEYHFNGLSGAGVAYKFITYKFNNPLYKRQWVDLAAMGIVADVMPLVDENRNIVRNGLLQLSRTKRPGLIALKQIQNVNNNYIDASTVGFALGPILNAISRMGDANLGAKLLISSDMSVATQLAQDASKLNQNRKTLVNKLAKLAIDQGVVDTLNHEVLIVGGDESIWRQGVVGIVAANVVDEFHKPALAFDVNPKTKVIHGSARSVTGYNLYDALFAANNMGDKPVFLSMGGHAGAAGFSLTSDNLAELQTRLDKYVKAHPIKEPKEKLPIVKSMMIKDLTPNFYETLQYMAPYGESNPEPIFHIHIVTIDDVFVMGQDKNHVKVMGRDANGDSITLLGFFRINDEPALQTLRSNGGSLDVVGTINLNEWEGMISVQMLVKDWTDAPVIG